MQNKELQISMVKPYQHYLKLKFKYLLHDVAG